MANVSSLRTLCNATAVIHNELRKHRCEIERDVEESYRYGINAGFYVIVVILFYGTSVMLLIASHIKRQPKKISEDKQINSYLREFQVVQESSSRDNYRNLKRNMIDNLRRMGMTNETNVHHDNTTMSRCLVNTILPTTAIALQSSLTQGDNWIHVPHMTLNSIREYNGIDTNVVKSPTSRQVQCQHCPRPLYPRVGMTQNGDMHQAKVHKETLYIQSGRTLNRKSTSISLPRSHNRGHNLPNSNMHSEHVSSV